MRNLGSPSIKNCQQINCICSKGEKKEEGTVIYDDAMLVGKSLLHPQLWRVVYITSSTMKRSNLPRELFKTVYFTPPDGFQRRFCYSNGGFATVAGGLSFLLFPLNL